MQRQWQLLLYFYCNHPYTSSLEQNPVQLGHFLLFAIPGLLFLKLQPTKARFSVPSRRVISLFLCKFAPHRGESLPNFIETQITMLRFDFVSIFRRFTTSESEGPTIDNHCTSAVPDCCTPIMTGSKTMCTQCFNEFQLNKMKSSRNLRQILSGTLT